MANRKGSLPSRDSVTTIRDDGSRRFLYPADVHGRFTRARTWSGILLVAIYLLLPWFKIGGYPAVFLDVAERRFHFFGYTLAAQDMWLLFFLITGLGFTLFVLTSLFGRLWCGWACPQTVFLDHVYRRIERIIEGDATSRRQLAAAPWGAGKAAKCIVKHGLYVLVSAAIVHLFLAYFVSIPALWVMMIQAPFSHAGAFAFVAVATGILYFNFAWFREQLCIIICPYGRLQSALIDDSSMVIGYDTERGEPRGKVGTPDAGACIDCNRCVQVCPTGIDIRQGLQIECIGCAACIDACDGVMDRLKRPRGLVRYDSLNGFAGKVTRLLRPRLFIYLVLMAVGASAALYAFSTVKPANIGITRMSGAPFYMDAVYVRNQYMVRLVNKLNTPMHITLRVEDLPAGVIMSGFEEAIELDGNAETVRPLIIQVPISSYSGPFRVRFHVSDATGRLDVERGTEFIGPDALFMKMTTPAAAAPQPPPAHEEGQ